MRLIQNFATLLLSIFALTTQAQKKTASVKASTSPAASIVRGKAVYTAHCLACHQADGSGVPNMNPPLSRTKWVMGSKAVLVHQVLYGSSNKVEIDGDRFHNTMPPIPSLTDAEIADVLTYVRNSFKNKYSPVTIAEVKAERARKK
jgi:mono/diheme cytochrome c family protein